MKYTAKNRQYLVKFTISLDTVVQNSLWCIKQFSFPNSVALAANFGRQKLTIEFKSRRRDLPSKRDQYIHSLLSIFLPAQGETSSVSQPLSNARQSGILLGVNAVTCTLAPREK